MTEEVKNSTPEHEEPLAEPSIDELEQRIAALELESEENKANWLRSVADFKNYKRRTESEREELIRNAGAGLLLKLLPVLDDLGRAMAHVPAEIDNNPWLSGVKQVQRKFEMLLEGAGVQPITAVGEEFDPNFHEAVMYDEAGEDQANKVVEELQRGYKLGEKVLRPTMVKVGK
ncbi:MAG: nucleotide exchange factor GrpE [Herpetosiphonaceae bacterium]|nr:nucleotide exchange factor GrpE [Herpetosiphonaceae bacterium]